MQVIRVRLDYFLLLSMVLAVGYFTFAMLYEHFENRRVQVLSWSIANRIIVVDPGHGGFDPGSQGQGGLTEDEITLEVSLKLASILGQAGAVVMMTRESDTDLSDQNNASLLSRKRQDLSRRVALANDHNADAYISVHVNSFKSGPAEHGAQTFYQPGVAGGELLATHIQTELVRMLKNTSRQARGVDYYTTRNSNMPAVIVEIGFISNPQEEKMMSETDYQEKLAYAVYSGIVKYFAENITPTSGSVDIEKTVETFINNTGQDFGAP